MEAGLLEAAEELPLPHRELDAIELKLLWAYLADVDRKLKTFDQLLARIELFKEIINPKFLFKTMFVDKGKGFAFETNVGEELPPTQLSSGEQHELVLAYQLLFEVAPGSFICIDEPEISLHVTWQHRFLEDLRRIAGVSSVDFLVATHSPQIIHKSWQLAVDLEPPVS